MSTLAQKLARRILFGSRPLAVHLTSTCSSPRTLCGRDSRSVTSVQAATYSRRNPATTCKSCARIERAHSTERRLIVKGN